MTVDLEAYRGLVSDLGDQAEHVLRAAWSEAVQSFGPAALEVTYLGGARTLARLGRTSALPVAFLQHAPAVAREVGDACVEALVEAAVRFSSKTSQAVIERLIEVAPIAATRLADCDLFREFLSLIDELLGLAPRGVRPLLDRLEVLLRELTVRGLRRWALWGARAHAFDFDAQVRYFSLEAQEALSMLQRERVGTLLVDVQRRLLMYLRALWGRDFLLRPQGRDLETGEQARPHLEGITIAVADAYDDWHATVDGEDRVARGLELYRAAVAHAAAHAVLSRERFVGVDRPAAERALVGLVEDARIEHAARSRFPGFARLWGQFHVVSARAGEDPAALMARLARSLAEPSYADPHPWVQAARSVVEQRVLGRDEDVAAAVDAAVAELVELARSYGVALEGAEALTWQPIYRDDNAFLFVEEAHAGVADSAVDVRPQQQRRTVNVMEMVNAVDVPNAGDDADEI